MYHGFIKPSTIIVTQNNKPKPVFALMDMQLITGMDNSLDQMKYSQEDIFAPLSPRQMNSYKSGSPFYYDSKDDIWALGICTLCYILYEDFNIYYDWKQKEIKSQTLKDRLEALKCRTWGCSVTCRLRTQQPTRRHHLQNVDSES